MYIIFKNSIILKLNIINLVSADDNVLSIAFPYHTERILATHVCRSRYKFINSKSTLPSSIKFVYSSSVRLELNFSRPDSLSTIETRGCFILSSGSFI